MSAFLLGTNVSGLAGFGILLLDSNGGGAAVVGTCAAACAVRIVVTALSKKWHYSSENGAGSCWISSGMLFMLWLTEMLPSSMQESSTEESCFKVDCWCQVLWPAIAWSGGKSKSTCRRKNFYHLQSFDTSVSGREA